MRKMNSTFLFFYELLLGSLGDYNSKLYVSEVPADYLLAWMHILGILGYVKST